MILSKLLGMRSIIVFRYIYHTCLSDNLYKVTKSKHIILTTYKIGTHSIIKNGNLTDFNSNKNKKLSRFHSVMPFFFKVCCYIKTGSWFSGTYACFKFEVHSYYKNIRTL